MDFDQAFWNTEAYVNGAAGADAEWFLPKVPTRYLQEAEAAYWLGHAVEEEED